MKKLLRTVALGLSVALMAPMAFAEMVNINKADAATFQHYLKGIGEVKAKAIVDYRKKNGSFKSVDDLLNVPGIGEATIKKNKSDLSTSKGEVKAPAKSEKKTKSVSSSKSNKSTSTTKAKTTDKKEKTSKSKSSEKKSTEKKKSDSASKSSKSDKKSSDK